MPSRYGMFCDTINTYGNIVHLSYNTGATKTHENTARTDLQTLAAISRVLSAPEGTPSRPRWTTRRPPGPSLHWRSEHAWATPAAPGRAGPRPRCVSSSPCSVEQAVACTRLDTLYFPVCGGIRRKGGGVIASEASFLVCSMRGFSIYIYISGRTSCRKCSKPRTPSSTT